MLHKTVKTIDDEMTL